MLDGKAKFYFPELDCTVVQGIWEEGTLKKYTKSFDTEESWKKWKDEGKQPQWANEY